MSLKQNLGRLALAGVRSRIGSALVKHLLGWIFTHMSHWIPVQRLRETPTLLAFVHPSPGYPVHIVLVPRGSIGSLAELRSEDAEFMVDLFATVQSLVKELELEECGYRLIANGGKYQEAPHLHFHLVAEKPPPHSLP
jgi:histidine triad (HIT) family protein